MLQQEMKKVAIAGAIRTGRNHNIKLSRKRDGGGKTFLLPLAFPLSADFFKKEE